MKANNYSRLLAIFMICSLSTYAQKWDAIKTNKWSNSQIWISGANYQPASAINQLEMFQEATFDLKTMDKELELAEGLGFNTMRVFLHHAAWTTDKVGFKKRLAQYLEVSYKHKIKTIFVFFDDCWNDTYSAGTQPLPKMGIHNSGWIRDPGTMIYKYPDSLSMLKNYVTDVMTSFKNDHRILMWDLYNEPGNSSNENKSLPLLKAVFSWARSVNPSQPITAGVWSFSAAFDDLNKFQLENSDVITYHYYGYVDAHLKKIKELKIYGRPLICTEYMARRNGSLFQTIMPLLKDQHVGAINWGFVSGKTNTIFAWDTPVADGKEPELWFHDIYRQDGTPFSENEVQLIRKLNGKR